MEIDDGFEEEIAERAERIFEDVTKKTKGKEVTAIEFKIILVDEMDVDLDEFDIKTSILLFDTIDKIYQTLGKYNNDDNKLMYV